MVASLEVPFFGPFHRRPKMIRRRPYCTANPKIPAKQGTKGAPNAAPNARLVKEYLGLVFSPDALAAGGPRPGGGAGAAGGLEVPPFGVPRTSSLTDYKLCIQQMNDIDNPASFGMASNVDRSLQRINTQQVIANLRTLKTSMSSAEETVGSGGGGGGGAASGGAITNLRVWREHIAPLWKFWEGTKLGGTSMRIRPIDPNSDTPITSFVLLDAAEAQRILQQVSAHLSQIKKVVSGTGREVKIPYFVSHARNNFIPVF